ncbi:MAG: T9SS type A sorting domain-containing protein [Saprospiraceae bacterium]
MKKLLLSFLALYFFSISDVFCQWERTAGPQNQKLTDIQHLDGFQVAISNRKVLNRQNASTTWSPASGIPNSFVVFYLHQTSSASFVQNNSTQFYRSTNGVSWSPLVSPDTSLVLNNLFGLGDTLFAEAKMIGTSPDQYRLLLSANNGDTWTDVTPPETIYHIRDIIKEGMEFRIYFRNQPGFGNFQVHRSSDGINWSFFLQSQFVPDVQFAGRQVYFFDWPNGGFRFSDNLGATWSSTQTFLKPEGGNRAIFRNDHAMFACFLSSYRRIEQIYRTYDGLTWTELPNLPPLYSRPFLIGNSLYAIGDYNQVYTSADNGDTWLTVGAPLPSDFKLLGISSDSSKPIAYGVGGIYANYADGTFGMQDHEGIPPLYSYVGDIVNHNGTLIAGGEGLFRSDNQGDSWEEINNGTLRLPFIFFDDLLLFSSENQVIAGGEGRLYHSYDNGNTWGTNPSTPVWRDEHGSFCMLSGNADTLFASKLDSVTYNIYRSFDGGNSWSKITPGNLSGSWGVFYAGGRVFLRKLVDGGAMKVSNNLGNTWTNYYNGMFSSFRSLAYTNGVYYAGGFEGSTDDKKILRSTNGMNWEEIVFDTFPGQYEVMDIIAKDSLLVVATEYDGIFLSSDHGNTWSNMLKNEPGIYRAFALEIDSLYLYVGAENGVWRWRLTNLPSAVKDPSDVFSPPISVNPNPATQDITITLSSQNSEAAQGDNLVIFDSKGRVIFDQPFQNGNKLNVSHLPSGVYFLSLTSGKISCRGKFLKM